MSLSSWSERRRSMRVSVRGTAVVQAGHGPVRGTVENLSHSGALLAVPAWPVDQDHDLELQLHDGGGVVGARTVRIESRNGAYHVAVVFDRVDPAMRASIASAIEAALAAARLRPILVIDEPGPRRTQLIDRLIDRGMTPLAPRTPLETIDLLIRTNLQIDVCLLPPERSDLASVLADSFPWVTTSEISDDVGDSVARAIETWQTTPVARIGVAIG
jgi:hypothetical protein